MKYPILLFVFFFFSNNTLGVASDLSYHKKRFSENLTFDKYDTTAHVIKRKQQEVTNFLEMLNNFQPIKQTGLDLSFNKIKNINKSIASIEKEFFYQCSQYLSCNTVYYFENQVLKKNAEDNYKICSKLREGNVTALPAPPSYTYAPIQMLMQIGYDCYNGKGIVGDSIFSMHFSSYQVHYIRFFSAVTIEHYRDNNIFKLSDNAQNYVAFKVGTNTLSIINAQLPLTVTAEQTFLSGIHLMSNELIDFLNYAFSQEEKRGIDIFNFGYHLLTSNDIRYYIFSQYIEDFKKREVKKK